MRRALLCACSEYRDPAFAALKYPLNDIDQIQKLLEEPELCGFGEVDVLRNPGRGDVHEAVEHLTADSAGDDFILFYFSGHGKLAPDGSVALVLADTKEGRLHSTGLLDDQLRILFNASRARQRVIILDCCYSGAVGEEGFKRVSGDAVEALAQQVKGTFVLSASTKFQPALECDEARGSAFTACLIEGVRTGAAAEKGTGRVTLSKLGEYLVREVPRRSNQQPKFWDFGGVGATVFAQAPKLFDAAWTEQTLKRLRQMLAREQIDDQLFVDLQQALGGGDASLAPPALALIDDLAQRRLKPVTFLRRWQAQQELASSAAPSAEPVIATARGPLQSPAAQVAASATGGQDEPRPGDGPPVEQPILSPAEPPRSAFPHPAQLIASLLGLIFGTFILRVGDSYDYTGESYISRDELQICALLFAVAQAWMVFVIWRLLSNQVARAAVVIASLAGAWGVIGGIEGRDLGLLQGASVGILWPTAVLLIVLHLQRRGAIVRQREGE